MKSIEAINIFESEFKGERKIEKIVRYRDGYLIIGKDPTIEGLDCTGDMFYINPKKKISKIFYPEDFEGISKALEN